MSLFGLALSPEEIQLISQKGLSNYEKLILAMEAIKHRHPQAVITCEEIAEFINGNPKKIRGIRPLLTAIKKRYPTFPDHMIEKSKNSRDIREGLLAETRRELGLDQ
jgi:hypothetical protein